MEVKLDRVMKPECAVEFAPSTFDCARRIFCDGIGVAASKNTLSCRARRGQRRSIGLITWGPIDNDRSLAVGDGGRGRHRDTAVVREGASIVAAKV